MSKLLSKTIEYALYLLLFILPWQTRWIIKAGDIDGAYFEYGTYSLYASDIVLIFLLLLSGLYFYWKKPDLDKIKYQKIWLALLVIDVAALISIFVAPDHYLAIYKYVNFLFGVLLFTLIVYFPYNKTKALFCFFSAFAIQVLVAIWQFLNQLSPGNKWLGMSEHISYNPGVSVVEAMGNLGFVERWTRSYGSLDHPNILGGFLVIALLLLILLSVRKCRDLNVAGDDDFRREIFKVNVVSYLLVLLGVVAILFSFSRSAWLAGFIGVALFLFIISLKKEKLLQKYLLPLVLYSGIVVFILAIPFSNLINARLKGEGRIEKISSSERIESINTAGAILKDKWLFGTGIGNFTMTLKNEYIKDKPVYFYQPTHNTYLLVWAEIGLLGIFGFLLLLLFILLESLKGESYKFRLPLFTTLLVLLFFDHWYWSLHFGFLYFCLIIGFVLVIFELDKKKENVL